MASIRLNGNLIDFSQLPATPSSGPVPKYVLVRLQGQLKPEDATTFGAIFRSLQFVGSDTYLCYHLGTNLMQDVGKLRFIASCVPYPSNLKLSKTLQQSQSDMKQSVVVVLHSYPDGGAVTAGPQIQKICSEPAATTGLRLQVAVSGPQLAQLAALDAVKSIEPVMQLRTAINNARKIVQVPNQQPTAPAPSTTTTSSSRAATAPAVSPLQYAGQGEIITVVDTGLDTGIVGSTHPAFGSRVRLIKMARFPGKAAALLAGSRDAGGRALGPAADTEGHGTHVAGCALGGDGEMAGPAPAAELVAVKFGYRVLTLLPDDFFQITVDKEDKELAKIINNSWSSVVQDEERGGLCGAREYTDGLSGVVDAAVWRDHELVICFSTGNAGDLTYGMTQQLGGVAASKNCITVGGTQNARPMDPRSHSYREPFQEKTDTSKAATIDGQPANTFGLNSRGPTMEGRIKPDVLAPGAAISAPRSSLLSGNQLNEYQQDPDHRGYGIASGSSMAAPIVAGCVAVLREALRKQPANVPSGMISASDRINVQTTTPPRPLPPLVLNLRPSPSSSTAAAATTTSSAAMPSAALLKALIVNGADDLSLENGKFYTLERINVMAGKPDIVPTVQAAQAARNAGTSAADQRMKSVLGDAKIKADVGLDTVGAKKPPTADQGVTLGLTGDVKSVGSGDLTSKQPLKQGLAVTGLGYSTDAQGSYHVGLYERPIPPAPNSIQGFGRVNLRRSLEAVQNRTYREAIVPLTGLPIEFPFMVATTARELTVTLVWTDHPGEMLQTLLWLTVEIDPPASTGAVQPMVLQPNQGVEWTTGPWTGQANDTENNVQRITCTIPPNTMARAFVTCLRRCESQPAFAVVWSLQAPVVSFASSSTTTSTSNAPRTAI